MSIKYAVLGILSYNSYTGYDLKKIIQDSPFMHWSGNNNQIYRSLVELLGEGLVTNEVLHQESSPSKKLYTITEEGRVKLKEWILLSPEPPEFKKSFLVQLAWADQLMDDELNDLLMKYEYEINMQILLQQEMIRRGPFLPNRSPREEFIWNMIHKNIISAYENEVKWVDHLRQELCEQKEENNTMNYTVIEENNKKYIECATKEASIHNEQSALDLIGACFENETNLILIHMDALSDDFFKLRTGLAGSILQKFVNYNIKIAVVITDTDKVKGKFKDLLVESNNGNDFRVFNSKNKALNWITNL